MADSKPFTVRISEQQIDDLKTRLSLTRYPEKETVTDWSQGMPLAYTRELAEYWRDRYDMRRLEQRLNALPQFIAEIDGLDIHFIHVRSPEPDARPLILSHGWPGSVVEFLKVIPLLTDPKNHGGNAGDAFHVVCPSLPGYGFSERPASTGWDVPRIAKAFAQLMGRLGYSSYFAQGGDWGSGITTSIAQQDANCRAIHLNFIFPAPQPAQVANPTDEEKSLLAKLHNHMEWEAGYSTQQMSRPQTLGYSLVDSPVGQLAWIVEKFHAWSDCNGDPEKAISRDEILDNVMLYWITATGASSGRLYWQGARTFVQGEVTTPMGFSRFPKENLLVSRRWAENTYKNIVYWRDVERGGHFAAFEQPAIFARELREFFRGR